MKVVVLVSGGLDSTVLLADQIAKGRGCVAVSFDYGQKHIRELTSARLVAGFYNAEQVVVPLTGIFGPSALTSEDRGIPVGHYEDDSMKATVVSNRNMVFLSIAIALAITRGASEVAYGAHGGDRAVYPDCRTEFVDAMREAAALCDEPGIVLSAPFVEMSKADIVRRGVELGAPFGLTWTCYDGGVVPCGKCGACVERAEAFALNGLRDDCPGRE